MYDAQHDNNTDKAVIKEWLYQCSKQGIKAALAAQDTRTITSIDAGRSMADAICEVYKYSIKATDTLAMPLDILYDFAVGLAGKRMISMGGAIKQAARDLAIEQLEQADEGETVDICTSCGCKQLDNMIATWSTAGMHYYTVQGRTISEEIDRLEREREARELLNTDD